MVSLHREYHLAIKKKEILPSVTASMDLESIMLSEIASQRKINTISLIVEFHEHNEQNKLTNK